jgi:hypothetical protein
MAGAGGFMRRIGVVVVIGLLALGAVACDDDSDGDSGAETLADLPVYEGATLLDSRGTGDGGTATYRTTDDAPTVQRFFEEQLRSDGWTVEIDTQGEDTVLRATDPENPGEGVDVVIREAEDGTTQIVQTTPDDEEDIDEDEGEDERDDEEPEETPVVNVNGLPAGYPSNLVPLPSGITVTTASGPAEQGDEIYTVEFDSDASVESVVSHFNTQLAANGWTQDLNRPESPFTLTFANGDGSVAVTGFGDDDGSHVNVTITLQ